MEAQDLNPPEAVDDDVHMSGLVPTASVANSGPEVDVRLRQSGLIGRLADLNPEQRQRFCD
jgi:hypothetical protein